MMRELRSVCALRAGVKGLRDQGKSLALVPTMGSLHDGHISLVDVARRHADAVVVSIFVNPAQFNRKQDFQSYPRDEAADLVCLREAGVDLAWLPDVDEMYPPGFVTGVSVGGLTGRLEGEYRPGHFDGVATVVTKLLLQTLPDVAVFGEKDWQQLAVIRRMVADLDIPAGIIGAPTRREADGLAMSSRNLLLSAEQRALAPVLYQAMLAMAAEIRAGRDIADAGADAEKAALAGGFDALDYLEACDADTLEPLTHWSQNRPARILAAGWMGDVRLIDNIAL